MVDKKISQLPAATSALLADEFPVNEAGTTKKVTLAQVQKSFGAFNVKAYGAVGDGVTDDGPAFSAAIAAAAATVVDYTKAIVTGPPGTYRIKTSIIVKSNVRLEMPGAWLVGPTDDAGVISGATTAAGVNDVAAQTAGACFTDAEEPVSAVVLNPEFIGMRITGFRFGFVTKAHAWSQPLWRDIFFENCNVGIFAYQGAIFHRLLNVRSGGGSTGVTYIAAATCFAATHPYAGLDNAFCDSFTYIGETFSGSAVNAFFDTWFAASILRAGTTSVTAGGSVTFGFTGTALTVTGRNIYIPSRNKRGVYNPIIRNLTAYGGDLGALMIGNPIRSDFWQIAGEVMFASGPQPLVTVLLSGSGSTGAFAHIDGLNTTNPSSAAIAVIAEPGGSSTPASFLDHGDILGGVIGYATNFTAADTAPINIYVGPFDPRTYTLTGPYVANYAWITQFQVFRAVTVSKARLYIATQAGNIDIGLYDSVGVRLGSTGPTACPAVGSQSLNLTGSVTLYPGTLYYSAFLSDSSATAIGRVTCVVSGVVGETWSGYVSIGSGTLPASGMAVPGTSDLTAPMIVYLA